MPLLPGSDKGVVGENIRELVKSGRPQTQAIAIAMRVAGKSKPKKMAKMLPMAPKPPMADDLGDHEYR